MNPTHQESESNTVFARDDQFSRSENHGLVPPALVITQSQFRGRLMALMIAMLVGVTVSVATEVSARHAPGPETRPSPVFIVSGCILLTMFAISYAGLFTFKSYARTLLVLTWACGGVLQAFPGPVVESGLVAALGGLISVLKGIILGLLYFSPAKLWFDPPSVSQPKWNDKDHAVIQSR